MDPTCVLMGELAGPVVPAALRSQPIDDVVLVEYIPCSRIKEVFHIPSGLEVGLGVPEGRRYRKD